MISQVLEELFSSGTALDPDRITAEAKTASVAMRILIFNRVKEIVTTERNNEGLSCRERLG
jgi:hypothetical protein